MVAGGLLVISSITRHTPYNSVNIVHILDSEIQLGASGMGEAYLDVVDNLRCDLVKEVVAEWVGLGCHD
jgi:hypothetical protein